VLYDQSKHNNLFIIQNQQMFRLIYSHHQADYKNGWKIHSCMGL